MPPHISNPPSKTRTRVHTRTHCDVTWGSAATRDGAARTRKHTVCNRSVTAFGAHGAAGQVVYVSDVERPGPLCGSYNVSGRHLVNAWALSGRNPKP